MHLTVALSNQLPVGTYQSYILPVGVFPVQNPPNCCPVKPTTGRYLQTIGVKLLKEGNNLSLFVLQQVVSFCCFVILSCRRFRCFVISYHFVISLNFIVYFLVSNSKFRLVVHETLRYIHMYLSTKYLQDTLSCKCFEIASSTS